MLRNPLSRGAAAVATSAAPFVSGMLDQMPNSVYYLLGPLKISPMPMQQQKRP